MDAPKKANCRFFLKQKESVCLAAGLPTTCDGNLWYCDWVKQRKNAERKENDT